VEQLAVSDGSILLILILEYNAGQNK